MAGDDGRPTPPRRRQSPPPSHPGPKTGGAGAIAHDEQRLQEAPGDASRGGGARRRGGRRGGDGEFKRPATSKAQAKPRGRKKPGGTPGRGGGVRVPDRARNDARRRLPEHQGDRRGARWRTPRRARRDGRTSCASSPSRSPVLGGDAARRVPHLVNAGWTSRCSARRARRLPRPRKDAAEPRRRSTPRSTARPRQTRKTHASSFLPTDPARGSARLKTAVGRLRTTRRRAISEARARAFSRADVAQREKYLLGERFASGRVAFAFALDARAPDAPVTTVRSASEADAFRDGKRSPRARPRARARALRKVADAIARALARGGGVAGSGRRRQEGEEEGRARGGGGGGGGGGGCGGRGRSRRAPRRPRRTAMRTSSATRGGEYVPPAPSGAVGRGTRVRSRRRRGARFVLRRRARRAGTRRRRGGAPRASPPPRVPPIRARLTPAIARQRRRGRTRKRL